MTSGHNRWYDKSLQIICAKNGKAGLVGEHSMMDGMPMVDFTAFVNQNKYNTGRSKLKLMENKTNESSNSDNVKNIFSESVGQLQSNESNVELMIEKGMLNRSIAFCEIFFSNLLRLAIGKHINI
jgi:carnitine O-acetyltransferase